MSKADNLKDFMVDLATAIRTKKETTDPINPQNFSKEILEIETGGEEAKVAEKQIFANGVYVAAEDNLDGYSVVEVSVTPKLQDKTATANGDVEADSDYDGLSKVTVNVAKEVKLQSKTVKPTTTEQSVTPDEGYDGLESVTVNKIDVETYDVTLDKMKTPTKNGYSKLYSSPTGCYCNYIRVYPVTAAIDSNITADNIKKDVTILGVEGTYEGEGGSTEIQVYPKPMEITENGSYFPPDDYDAFSEVRVNVLEKDLNLQAKEGITPTLATQTISPDEGYNGLLSVEINGVKTKGKTVDPSNDTQIVQLKEGEDDVDPSTTFLSSVTVNPITGEILKKYDENFIADNIKYGVEIYKLKGTYKANSVKLGEQTFTANGEYSASDDELDGYSKVIVNVASELEEKEWTVDLTTANGDEIDIPSNVKITKIILPRIENLIAKNVREGVTILDVTGTLDPDTIIANEEDIKPLELSMDMLITKTAGGNPYVEYASNHGKLGFNPVYISPPSDSSGGSGTQSLTDGDEPMVIDAIQADAETVVTEKSETETTVEDDGNEAAE